jgi:hypothetical protein
MPAPTPFLATVLRPPAPTAVCSCDHPHDCVCACHERACDPTEHVCDLAFLPDEGGLARWGCRDCTPGVGAPHELVCELLGWSVPYRERTRSTASPAGYRLWRGPIEGRPE